jgi:hypothetical protein
MANIKCSKYQISFDPLEATRGLLVATAVMIPVWVIIAVLALYL